MDCFVFLPKLTELQLNDVELRESDIEQISSLASLKSLSLRGCRALNDATYFQFSLGLLMHSLPLPLSDFSPFPRLPYIGWLKRLEDLGIGSTLVSNLRPLVDLLHLRYLNIAHCRLIPLGGYDPHPFVPHIPQ